MPLELTFDQTVDIGAFLTFVTLIAAFFTWCFKTVKEWRRDARSEAESGALRLLLKILRERYEEDKGPISLKDLRADFESPKRKSERRAYCDRDFLFKDDEHFERAIYQLQWEFKIDFAAGDRILFRTALPTNGDQGRSRLRPTLDSHLVMESLESALADPSLSEFDVEGLGRLAATTDPGRAQQLLERAIERVRDDGQELRRLLLIASRLSA